MNTTVRIVFAKEKKKRVETVWSGSAIVISRNEQKADFVWPRFDWCLS